MIERRANKAAKYSGLIITGVICALVNMATCAFAQKTSRDGNGPSISRVEQLEKRLDERLSALEAKLTTAVDSTKVVVAAQAEAGKGLSDAAKTSNGWVQHWINNIIWILSIIIGICVGAVAYIWNQMTKLDDRYKARLEEIDGSEIVKSWEVVEARLNKLKHQQDLDELRFETIFAIGRNGFNGDATSRTRSLDAVNLTIKLCSASKRNLDRAATQVRADKAVPSEIEAILPKLEKIYKEFGDPDLSSKLEEIRMQCGS